MAVPFIDLQRFEPGFLDRWADLSREITELTQFVGGLRVAELERKLVEVCQVDGVVACANGTDALQLALRAAGVGAGDVVLIPDATFWATFEAVVNCGARAHTVDIDPEDLQMDFELFKRAVDVVRPKAAILVHLYGWGSARLDDFRELCRERSIPLIEDGAQAFGVSWKGASIFREAYLATLSFYPAKVLGACGDAGAVLCSSDALTKAVRCLGNHGRTGHYEHGLVGWNSRMSGFDAAYLSLSLEYIHDRLASRRRAATLYRKRLQDLGLRTAAPPPGYGENGYLNVLLWDAERREELLSTLRELEIGFGITYPGAMSDQPGAAGHLAGSLGGDRARRLSREVVNLPLFAHIREAEIEEALRAVEQVL